MHRSIPLPHGLHCIVDGDVWEWASEWCWSQTKGGYVVRRETYAPKKSRIVYLHRLVMKAGPEDEVHHGPGGKLDNRRSNLRLWNTHDHQTYHGHTSGPITGEFKGVFWSKREQRWIAKIKHKQKNIHIGTFHDPEDAACAYDQMALRLFGIGCYLNFPRKADAQNA